MLFNVPFIPDEGYVSFLGDQSGAFYAYHFSLYSDDVDDARYRFKRFETDQIISHLKALGRPKKYLLINNRVHHPGRYADTKGVLKRLEAMLAAGVLDGIVYADAYFLQALSDASHEVAAQLEAVPSVNFMIDDFEKAAALLDAISMTAFKLPEKLALDRSLNRRMEALSRMAVRCRRAFPALKLELLANEGCLYQCPFKMTHDAHISLVHMGMNVDTHAINRSLGCMRYLAETPQALFKSPFIRPEDMGHYQPYVDIIKICGRTLGPSFLKQVITAYLEKTFAGNLLDLMDALDWMAHRLHVDNAGLPSDFFSMVTTCTQRCDRCGRCTELYRSHCREKDPMEKKGGASAARKPPPGSNPD